ncbi:MAG: molybdenum cofactor synthesis protein [Bacteroidetes bacterium HGW-Bacteroidetes-6]|jgi:molybdenum cofactor synthesis domain-containing protein|nr:MAG: molybdenum cofactor synthesis protein [Bacteroidetes bacterium HGW-Bacteroidetes-6]
MSEISILAVNISEKKGTVKIPVDSIQLCDTGVSGDAHSGKWHRMVSMLAAESVEKFEHKAGRKINFGEFAENITTKGMLLYETHPLDRFAGNGIELEVTQIGKECHGDACAIYREVGNCVMPKEGIFVRVINGGTMKSGDKLEYIPKVQRIHIITLSDRAFGGEYEDRSGPAIEQLLKTFFETENRQYSIQRTIIADNPEALEALIAHSVNENFDAIFTTGGTGVGERDITPETVVPLLDKELNGIMDMIRLKYGQNKPQALLSRSVAGTIAKTQLYCLPGSVKACNEYMTEILKTYHHLMLMLHAIDAH